VEAPPNWQGFLSGLRHSQKQLLCFLDFVIGVSTHEAIELDFLVGEVGYVLVVTGQAVDSPKSRAALLYVLPYALVESVLNIEPEITTTLLDAVGVDVSCLMEHLCSLWREQHISEDIVEVFLRYLDGAQMVELLFETLAVDIVQVQRVIRELGIFLVQQVEAVHHIAAVTEREPADVVVQGKVQSVVADNTDGSDNTAYRASAIVTGGEAGVHIHEVIPLGIQYYLLWELGGDEHPLATT
jgi:hypothetical protein